MHLKGVLRITTTSGKTNHQFSWNGFHKSNENYKFLSPPNTGWEMCKLKYVYLTPFYVLGPSVICLKVDNEGVTPTGIDVPMDLIPYPGARILQPTVQGTAASVTYNMTGSYGKSQYAPFIWRPSRGPLNLWNQLTIRQPEVNWGDLDMFTMSFMSFDPVNPTAVGKAESSIFFKVSMGYLVSQFSGHYGAGLLSEETREANLIRNEVAMARETDGVIDLTCFD